MRQFLVQWRYVRNLTRHLSLTQRTDAIALTRRLSMTSWTSLTPLMPRQYGYPRLYGYRGSSVTPDILGTSGSINIYGSGDTSGSANTSNFTDAFGSDNLSASTDTSGPTSYSCSTVTSGSTHIPIRIDILGKFSVNSDSTDHLLFYKNL